MIVPSLPGFPGGDRGHSVLDTHLDWVLAVRELIDKADLAGADLVGSSVGGSFAAEVAAIWPDKVKRLALIAPFGLFDEKDPATDPWAQKADDIPGLMTARPGDLQSAEGDAEPAPTRSSGRSSRRARRRPPRASSGRSATPDSNGVFRLSRHRP